MAWEPPSWMHGAGSAAGGYVNYGQGAAGVGRRQADSLIHNAGVQIRNVSGFNPLGVQGGYIGPRGMVRNTSLSFQSAFGVLGNGGGSKFSDSTTNANLSSSQFKSRGSSANRTGRPTGLGAVEFSSQSGMKNDVKSGLTAIGNSGPSSQLRQAADRYLGGSAPSGGPSPSGGGGGSKALGGPFRGLGGTFSKG